MYKLCHSYDLANELYWEFDGEVTLASFNKYMFTKNGYGCAYGSKCPLQRDIIALMEKYGKNLSKTSRAHNYEELLDAGFSDEEIADDLGFGLTGTTVKGLFNCDDDELDWLSRTWQLKEIGFKPDLMPDNSIIEEIVYSASSVFAYLGQC